MEKLCKYHVNSIFRQFTNCSQWCFQETNCHSVVVAWWTSQRWTGTQTARQFSKKWNCRSIWIIDLGHFAEHVYEGLQEPFTELRALKHTVKCRWNERDQQWNNKKVH